MATLVTVGTLRVYRLPFDSNSQDLQAGTYDVELIRSPKTLASDVWIAIHDKRGNLLADTLQYWFNSGSLLFGDTKEFLIVYEKDASMRWRWLPPTSGSQIAYFAATHGGKKPFRLPSGTYVAEFGTDRDNPKSPSLLVTHYLNHRIGLPIKDFLRNAQNTTKFI